MSVGRVEQRVIKSCVNSIFDVNRRLNNSSNNRNNNSNDFFYYLEMELELELELGAVAATVCCNSNGRATWHLWQWIGSSSSSSNNLQQPKTRWGRRCGRAEVNVNRFVWSSAQGDNPERQPWLVRGKCEDKVPSNSIRYTVQKGEQVLSVLNKNAFRVSMPFCFMF